MIADLLTFREVLVAALRKALPNPQDAEWLADLMLATQRRELAGQTIPRRDTERRERVLELLRQRVPAALIARRLGIHRATVHRIAASAKAA